MADLSRHPAVASGRVLDLRPADAFVAGHLAGAFSLPLVPWPAPGDLAARLDRELPSIFLPARHEPLLVMAAEPGQARAVAEVLQARGRWQTDWLAWPAGQGWPAGLPPAMGPRRGRLWSPPPFLRRWVHLLPPPAAGPVLDLACGSGRAAVWLASRGWRVTGIDHQREALDLARRLADLAGVRVSWSQADLRDPASLPAGPWSAVLLFRYLQRDLMPRLPEVLAPHGVVMLRTFRDAPGYVGNPQPRHRLRPGEAAGFWPPEVARVLVHEEGFDDDGRPTAGLVAQGTGRRR